MCVRSLVKSVFSYFLKHDGLSVIQVEVGSSFHQRGTERVKVLASDFMGSLRRVKVLLVQRPYCWKFHFFEISYKKKLTFSPYSNFLRCTCVYIYIQCLAKVFIPLHFFHVLCCCLMLTALNYYFFLHQSTLHTPYWQSKNRICKLITNKK